MAAKTLYDKIWDAHVVREEDGTALLYIDRHLVMKLHHHRRLKACVWQIVVYGAPIPSLLCRS